MEDAPLRVYATFKSTAFLLALYRRRDLRELTQLTRTLLAAAQRQTRQPQGVTPDATPDIEAVAAPSLDWRAAFVTRDSTEPPAVGDSQEITPDTLVIAYAAPGVADAGAFVTIVNEHRDVPLDAYGNAFRGAGADPGASVADHWCPIDASQASFGNRAQARRTIRAEALAGRDLRGQRVNVVIIDEGLDRAAIPARNWGGGLDHLLDTGLVLPAGSAPRTSHGMMIARSVLDLAPDAKLYDVPVIPANAPPALPIFISTVQAAWTSLLQAIQSRRALPRWSGPWVLVNAWGIFDTTADPLGGYTRNAALHGHPMVNLVTDTVQQHRLDVIFAAGNCGQFCPNQQCGALDRGPGHGIWGANAHPLVITAGAVRSDETWIGYSSQGPGPELLAVEKPDLCAPSQFRESDDAAVLNSGTSAACAMVAGVVAALRGNAAWDQSLLKPQAVRAALIAATRKPHGATGWHNRLGHGILDAAATMAALPP